MSHDEVLAEAERLQAEHDAALKEMQKSIKAVRPTGGHVDADNNRVERTPRYIDAAARLGEFRQFWRQIGEAVDVGQPGHREFLKITSNDGSVAS